RPTTDTPPQTQHMTSRGIAVGISHQHDVYAFSDQPALQFGVQELVTLLLIVPDDRHAPANTAHDIARDRGWDFPPADVVMSIITFVGDGEHGFGLLGKCLHYGLIG